MFYERLIEGEIGTVKTQMRPGGRPNGASILVSRQQLGALVWTGCRAGVATAEDDTLTDTLTVRRG